MTPRIPKYQLHRGTGQAKVRIEGRDFYLGQHGSEESRQRYDQLVDKWLRNGRTLEVKPSKRGTPSKVVIDEITVVELCLRYLRYCEEPFGKPNGVHRTKQMIRRVRKVAGSVLVSEFGPLKLQSLQGVLVREKLSRTYINNLIDTCRDMFRWGVGQELVPAEIWQALKAVSNLRKGRSEARETDPVRVVEDDVVEATLGKVGSVVGAMIRIQRLTGMRPGEVCLMRPCDIDRSGPVWFYIPSKHKTEHKGKCRIVALGPQAQGVLLPYLDRDHEVYCFSPQESEKLRLLDLRRERKSKVQPSQKCRKQKRPKHQPGERYNTASYGHAVREAARRAGLAQWSPNRLRHSVATNVEGEFTLEDAAAVLGHARVDTTRRYSEAQKHKAAEVMLKLG